MNIVLLSGVSILTIVYSIVWLVRPLDVIISQYELARRQKAGDTEATLLLRRRQAEPLLWVLRRLMLIGLLVGLVLLLQNLFAWWWVIAYLVLLTLILSGILRISFLQRHLQRLYTRYEPALIRGSLRYKKILLINARHASGSADIKEVYSLDELRAIVTHSRKQLSVDRQQAVLGAIDFEQRRVADSMTLRRDMVTVKSDELLGPLVLDGLHKTGHRFFPVIAGSPDEIVGVLDSAALLSLDKKRSLTATSSMQYERVTIRSDAKLADALKLCVENNVPLLVVVDDDNRTEGIVTLSAMTKLLLPQVGR